MLIHLFAQAAQAAQSSQTAAAETATWGQRVLSFFDTPLPFSPFSEYMIVLFVLWLLAHRADRRSNTFDTKAQDVLDEKFAKGEISKAAYEKFRQQMALEQQKR